MAFSSTTFGYLVNVLASFILALTWIALLSAVVPTKRTVFNVIGSNTLYPYILHPTILFIIRKN